LAKIKDWHIVCRYCAILALSIKIYNTIHYSTVVNDAGAHNSALHWLRYDICTFLHIAQSPEVHALAT